MNLSARISRLASVALLTVAGTVATADDRPIEVRIEVADRSRLEQLTRLVSVSNVQGRQVSAEVTARQLELLRDAGFSWRTVATREVNADEMCPPGWVDDPERTWNCYPTYAQYVGLMERFAATHPDLCRLESLGPTSNQVRPHDLWALRISDFPEIEEAEPEVMLTSTMHGNEATGFVLMLRLIHELLEGYGVDPQATALVDELEIWINPNANPDGTYFAGDDTVAGAIRFYSTPDGEATDIDANRNFPDPDEGDHPDGNPWWAETQAMMAFAETHTTTLSANLHDGSEVVNYPWDTWERRHVDDEHLISISRAYADLAQALSPADYMTDQSNGITNGWDWYPVAGGRQDFMTFWHSAREVTIEISRTKTPPAAELGNLWSWNRNALLDFMGRAREGVHGIVTGPDGEPLDAVIELVGHDALIDNSFVATDPDAGDYHRLVAPGTYTIRVSADGFHPTVIDNVPVSSEAPTVVDAVLQPVTAIVTGKVRTPAARWPVAGARVELLGTGLSTTTAGDGSFELDDVPPGEHTIRVSAEGYQTADKARAVAAPITELEFALAPLSFRRVTVLAPKQFAQRIAPGIPALP
jgi:hypothetical protein